MDSKRIGIVFLSGSAGELDWILPILDYLLKKNFGLRIIFLTKHAQESVSKNAMLNDYIFQENDQLRVLDCSGLLSEKLEHLSYLLYRAYLKLGFDSKPILRNLLRLHEALFKTLFLFRLPQEVKALRAQKCVFFSEYPSLRRPRDFWIKKEFLNSIFFYCPHSPHIYTEDLDREYLAADSISSEKTSYLLMGHPADYHVLNDNKELASSELEKVFIGHPKYSDEWLRHLQEKSRLFRSSSLSREAINILVLSRGSGSYLDIESHNKLVEMTVNVIDHKFKNYNLFIKKHPRETNSHWDNFLNAYPSIEIINDHILNIATRVDFVVSYWGSGAMDCSLLGVPVIEFFDPVKHSKQQVPEGDTYTTIYRKLGIVLPANNKTELESAITQLIDNSFVMPNEPHPYYLDLVERSNSWNIKIEQILQSHGLIND